MACRLVGAKPLSEPMLDIVDWTLRNKLQWKIDRNSNIFIHEKAFESVVWEMASILSRPQCVKAFLHPQIDLCSTMAWKSSLLPGAL